MHKYKIAFYFYVVKFGFPHSRKEQRPRMFENRGLMKVLFPKGDEVTGE